VPRVTRTAYGFMLPGRDLSILWAVRRMIIDREPPVPAEPIPDRRRADPPPV